MPNSTFALTMLLAGMCIPVMAALNAGLGRHLASPAAAAVVLFLVGLLATAAVLAATGPAALAGLSDAPRVFFLGGLLVAFYVISITAIAPRFGVGNAVFFVLIGQLISAALIDHFGLFGAPRVHLTVERAGGIALMAAGVVLTQRGSAG